MPADRHQIAQHFLDSCGWGGAARQFLAGDASDRSYQRLIQGQQSAVLMDAPPGKGDDPADFVAIARYLRHHGFSAPEIFAEDIPNGFLLIEDLGDDLYARLIPRAPMLEEPLYAAACDVLTGLHRLDPPPGLPDLTAADWAEAAGFALTWYRRAITGEAGDTERFTRCLTDLLRAHADSPRVMILRDYHAENLLWLPHRTGLARVGLLDFQLAQMGQPGYDLVSLLQDARRDVPLDLEAEMIARFSNGLNQTDFGASYAVLGAQRALRILGIFARLCLVAGKPGYVALIPRVWGQLQRNLAHPALATLAQVCAEWLPEPDSQALERIRSQCGTIPTV